MLAGDFINTKKYWDTLTRRVDPNVLITKMCDDVENEMARAPNPNQFDATSLMFNYFASRTVRPFDLIKVLMRKQILDPRFVKGIGVTGYDKIFNEV
jgi:agmatine/peptidylarginine deiminase